MTIHIATPHTNELWRETQARFIEANTPEDYRIYTRGAPFSHGTNLNFLAAQILEEASDDELIVFMDGDAFPIQPWVDEVRGLLEQTPLVAVQRLEAFTNEHPHPCFTVTTVGFWDELGGDWQPGPVKRKPNGKALVDVGGRLKGQLERAGIEWTPLTRLNTTDLHYRMFAVYGKDSPLVYHHGAGFRKPTFAGEKGNTPVADNERLQYEWYLKIQEDDNFWRALVS